MAQSREGERYYLLICRQARRFWKSTLHGRQSFGIVRPGQWRHHQQKHSAAGLLSLASCFCCWCPRLPVCGDQWDGKSFWSKHFALKGPRPILDYAESCPYVPSQHLVFKNQRLRVQSDEMSLGKRRLRHLMRKQWHHLIPEKFEHVITSETAGASLSNAYRPHVTGCLQVVIPKDNVKIVTDIKQWWVCFLKHGTTRCLHPPSTVVVNSPKCTKITSGRTSSLALCKWNIQAVTISTMIVYTSWLISSSETNKQRKDSLIKLGGLLQALLDLWRELSRILVARAAHVLALGMPHIAEIVQCACLPQLSTQETNSSS